MKLSGVFQELKSYFKQSTLYSDMLLINNLTDIGNIELKEKKTEELVLEYQKRANPSITCGVLVYNEEEKIDNCLSGVYKEFDEIIVLDSFSTDNTLEIIKSNYPNVHIYQQKWRNDFSYHRNLVIEKAKTDWIYFIDADNYYRNENEGKAKRIAKLLDFFGVICVVSPIITEHTGHKYIDTRRFFPLNNDISFSGKVHEVPLLNGSSPINISANIQVDHDGYTRENLDLKQKVKRNLVLTQDMLKIEPDNPKWFYFYGKELHLNKTKTSDIIVSHLTTAIELFRTKDNKNDKSHYVDCLVLLCTVLLENNNLSLLNKYLKVLDEDFPESADSIFFKASLLFMDIQNKSEKIVELLNTNGFSVINSNKDHLRYLSIKILSSLSQWDEVSTQSKSLVSKDMKKNLENEILLLKNTLETNFGENYVKEA